MLIFAEDNQIVFECEYCRTTDRLEIKRRNKRQFQTALNKFMRKHDWHCEYRCERQRKMDEATATANSIVEQLVAGCR
jgi:hypothetical protein